jgi:hypothetical protein
MAHKRVEGEIKNLTGNSFEVNNVKLELGPSASILVDCKHASVSDLKDGSKVKAAYEVRDGRNVVTILEAQK